MLYIYMVQMGGAVDTDNVGLSVQAFVGSAGDDGVLYVAMGTIATLGEAPACRPLHLPCLAGSRTSAAIVVWPPSLVAQDNARAPCLKPSRL